MEKICLQSLSPTKGSDHNIGKIACIFELLQRLLANDGLVHQHVIQN